MSNNKIWLFILICFLFIIAISTSKHHLNDEEKYGYTPVPKEYRTK